MRRVFLSSVLVALIGIACDGGADTDTTPDAASGGADTGTSGGVDARTGDTPDATNGGGIDADGAEGACVNSADQGVIDTVDVDGATTDCGNSCLLDSTPNCVRDCLVDATGLSQDCAGCYDGLVNCMISNCAFQCIDSGSADCETCRLTHCATPFTACSGL